MNFSYEIVFAIVSLGIWAFFSKRVNGLKMKNAMLDQECMAQKEVILRLESQQKDYEDACNQALTAKIRLEEEQKKAQEQVQFYSKSQETLRETFKAISSDALKETQKTFFDFAKTAFENYQTGFQKEFQLKQVAIQDVIKPLKDSLEKVDKKIHELESTRLSAFVGITEQLKGLALTQMHLQKETSNLISALRTPSGRGKWGEVQLRRVVEMAGMLEYCDFEVQAHSEMNDKIVRPDLVVRLPNSRRVVIDAKAPLQAYLEALDSNNEEFKKGKLQEHAKQVRKHLGYLGEKEYWEHFQPAPEFVILFLPAESFFSAALEHDPSLLEYGVDKRVILATPTTLIALLKAVACGWREEVLAKHAGVVSELGKALYERLGVMTDHFSKLRRSIESSVDNYNKAASSFESRVLVAARRFNELGAASDKSTLEELELIEKTPRSLSDEMRLIES